MKVRKNVLVSIILLFMLGLAQFAVPSVVFADSTVGNGTPGSCTAGALASAVTAGGIVDFNCGGSPLTITVSSPLVVSGTTTINGGGLITISGGDSQRVFTVNSGVTFTINNLTVSDGYMVGNGGGMFIDTGATVTITKSTFKDNNVLDGYGGAIYVNGATLNVSTSTFSNNGADVTSIGTIALGGGAIQNNDGTVEVLTSTFNGNTVTSPYADGGAIYNGDLDGAGNTPDANVDSLTVGNSTFYNNTLVNDTGSSSGGAIRSNGDITLAHNTFSDNDSGVSEASAGGESGAVTLAFGNATVVYNIFANSSSYTPNPAPAYDCAKRGSVTAVFIGGNVIETNFACGVPSGPLTVDPALGAFQDNGGPTYTMAPAGGSNAIGNAATCASGITTDQRGVARPQGGASSCDIGAVEVDTTAPTVTIEKAGGQGDPTNITPVNFTVTFSEPVVGFTTGDVNLSASTVGGSLVGTVTGGPTTFNVAVTGMTTPGDVVASINAGAATDIALNGNAAGTSSDNTVAFDATGASVTINKAGGQNDPTNVSTVNFTVVFDESVTGFDNSDVTIGGTANPTTKVVTGSGTTYNLAVGGLGNDGTVTASVNAGAVSDGLGNLSSASSTASVTYDGTTPTVSSIALVNTTPTNQSSVQFTVTFSESVTGGGASNFSLTSSVTGASIGTVTGSGTTRTVTVNTGTGTSGTIRLDMANTTGVADLAGNAVSNLPFTGGASYTVDKIVPTVTINKKAGQVDPTNASPIEFTVVFSESVIGFTDSDVTLSSGTATVTGGPSTYNVSVSGMAQGTLTASIPASAAADAAGNNSAASTSTDNEVAYDTVVPTVTINKKAGQSDPTSASPIEFTVVFSENVTGFTDSDVILSSGTATVTGGPSTYNVSVSGMAQGTLTASIPASAAADAAGNNSLASTTDDNSVVYDTTGPTVTIEQSVGQADPTGLTPANFTVVFSSPVTGFGSSSVAITGTAAGTKTATITEIAPNDGTTFTVAITGMTSSGTVIVNIPSSVVLDLIGNPNFASTSTDNSVTFNFVKPGVPVLTAPLKGIKVSGLQPLLDWNVSSPVAQYYQVQVSKVNTFASLVIDQTNLTDSQFTPASDLIPGSTYYWRVRGFNSIGQVSAWSSVFSFLTPLDVPVLNSPSGTLTTDRPTFDWSLVPGATSYVLQISKVNTFNSLVLSSSALTSPFTLTKDLLPNQPLFWRVQAKTATVTSAWSAFQSFTTGNPPSVPILAAPAANALVADFTPLFNWSDSTVPSGVPFKHYEIQVDDDANFANPLALTGTTTPTNIKDSQYTDNLTPLSPKTTYYWRVRSVSEFNTVDQYSAWSAVRTFRTVLATPVLATPADLDVLGTRRPTLDWQDVNGATKYQIAISRNPNMSNPIVSATVAIASIFTPVADLPANTLLYWHVRAVSTTYGSSSWSGTWSFTTGNPPSVPALLLPASNALMTTYQPSFDWSTSIIPASIPAGTFKQYEIQFAKDKNFSLGVFNRTTGNDPAADSHYQLQGGDVLDPNATYYWRVRAVSTIGSDDHTSSWSAVRTIRTPLAPPTSLTVTPNLTTPGKPTFDWDNVIGATGYTIQISKNANFSSPLVNASTSGSSASSYVPAINLPLNTPLYWRVLAKGTNTGLWASSTYTIIP